MMIINDDVMFQTKAIMLNYNFRVGFTFSKPSKLNAIVRGFRALVKVF